VLIFDHVVRNPVLAERGEKGAREPAKIVHNDYSFKSAPRRVRDHLPEEADRLLRNRFAEINVWRAIRGPIESSPLALCDARSLSPEDIVPSDLVYRERVGETYGFLYNPKHPLVLLPPVGAERGDLAEVLRLQGRWPRALHGAYVIRRSE
jgi:hypothetical protein